MSPVEKRLETMASYIKEGPGRIRSLTARSVELTRTLAEKFLTRPYDTIWIVASGSSFNAALCSRYYLRNMLGVEVKVVSPGSFALYEIPLRNEDFLFFISQSGYSTNTLAALDKARGMGLETLCLTGNVKADVKDHCDLVVDYGVGEEKVGYVTLGVTSLVTFLILFAIEAAYKSKRIDAQKAQACHRELLKAADLNEDTQRVSQTFIDKHYKALTAMDRVFLCGSGSAYGVAMEGALKLSETVQVMTTCYECEEFLHGPALQLTPNHTVFLVDSGDENSHRVHQIYTAVRTVTDRVYLLTPVKPRKADANVLALKRAPREELISVAYLPFFQILAYQITEDLQRWTKHPLYNIYKKMVDSKTSNYVDTEC